MTWFIENEYDEADIEHELDEDIAHYNCSYLEFDGISICKQ